MPISHNVKEKNTTIVRDCCMGWKHL